MVTEDIPVSVIIPTRNEERNIRECLARTEFAAERIVFDSYSTDETLSIAKSVGVKIVQRKFDFFPTHKNWAIDNINCKYDWILFVDADERVTAELAQEIAQAIQNKDGVVAYHVARKNLFRGVWIRHAGMYPDWQLRLFRRGHARYENRIVHEHMIVDGKSAFLKNPLVHHDFKGITRYIDRHNHYSTLEAIEAHRELNGEEGASVASSLFSRGPGHRRALKRFAYRHLPFRPVFVFVFMYFIRLGFLNGRQGFHYCVLRAIYDYQISLKLVEMKDDHSVMHNEYINTFKK